jgi:hypothetical protein
VGADQVAPFFWGKRPINRLLGFGHRRGFARLLAGYHHARNRRGPFEDAALDALNDGVFDVPISHH